MFSDECILKYNMYVCFPGHISMSGGKGTHECFGEEARAGETSCPMGITFSLKLEAWRMTIKNKGGIVDTENGEELKQLLRGNGRPPPENRRRNSRTCRAIKVK